MVHYKKQHILSKNKKYPGNTFHARMNTDENSLLSNACLKTWTIWLCGSADYFGFLCQWWMMWYFKHKRGSFLFSQETKPWKSQNFNGRKNAFLQMESQIGSTISQIITDEPIFIKLQRSNRFCTVCQGCKKTKVLNSDHFFSNSGYNGVSTAISILKEHILPSYN